MAPCRLNKGVPMALILLAEKMPVIFPFQDVLKTADKPENWVYIVYMFLIDFAIKILTIR